MLDHQQQDHLKKSLESAYPTQQDLEMIVYYGLQKNLNSIVPQGKLSYVIFKLISWAIAQGCIKDLVEKAYEKNSGNPELSEFYHNVWEPLINKGTEISAAPVVTGTTTSPTDANDNIDRTIDSPPSENMEIPPYHIEVVESSPAEILRVRLLTYTQAVQELLQKTQTGLTQKEKIYLDQCQTACRPIQQKSDILYTMLSTLLKTQLVDIHLHTQFGAEKDYFQREVEKIIRPLLEKSSSQVSLSYNECQLLSRKLATLEQILGSLEHYIDDFCCHIDLYADIYQFDFMKEKDR
jgi:Effector-associated domain 1